jgi:hypothetical protein
MRNPFPTQGHVATLETHPSTPPSIPSQSGNGTYNILYIDSGDIKFTTRSRQYGTPPETQPIELAEPISSNSGSLHIPRPSIEPVPK